MSKIKISGQAESDEATAPASPKWLTYLIEAMILLFGLLLVLLLRWGVYEPAYIPSGSMESTLKAGDRVVIDHRASLHGRWRRGDVILFVGDENWGEQETLIKRIIGLPGERVEIVDGQVSIDGKALAENYLKETPAPDDMQPVALGAGEYFVLGDNRNRSDDSRFNGTVKDRQIRGRTVLVFYPLGRFGRLPAPGYNR